MNYAISSNYVGANYGNSILGAQSVEPARVPEVSAQVASLGPNISHLHDLVAKLESRLENSVMRGQAAKECGNAAPRAIASTQLGGQVQEANDGLVGLAVRLNGIIERLEV